MLSGRLRAFAAALALAPAAGLLIASTPAQAATDIKVTSVSVSKSVVVLSSKAGCTGAVTFTAKLNKAMPATGYSFAGVGVDIYEPGNSSKPRDGLAFKRVGSTNTYQGTVKLCGRYKAGKFTAKVYGALVPTSGDAEFTNVITKAISLKRPSKVTLNAAPEPVVKGKKLTAAGVLKSDGKLLAKTSVKIYFKPAGKTTWAYKGTAVTNAKGAFSKKFTATRTGTWKVVYAGTGTRNTASATDAVKVK
ncbi:hypothetical protein GCM10010168_42540 [Actinoplanes ianthinogenes]|uniref:Uncharacterized protein n=1 Tax=Actinoplanes ianthinogenes TaxID=122358 RepID=A0ABM7LVS0_9ACTN|nr:hypothetical protein [Actinoplanes ianthinogenes]BCJ43436.1 hypothetical protein Aiant_40930 [Actinoplanes ianthinogenes]GGR20129.1 hypothetical protein GCM10010168_42540 [Actinoplanes ianthinogenes]